MARTQHRFTQITEGKQRQNYVFSIRQEKEIHPHEIRSFQRLTIYAWYLLPGPYYVRNYDIITHEWKTNLLVIKYEDGKIKEDYRPVNVPPTWLTKAIERIAA